MERKINKLEHSHVEVIATLEKEEWKKAQKKAFDKLAKNVEIKGFRKGKAPEALVKERINQMQVLNNAVDDVLPVIYRAIIDEDKIIPYAQPKVDVTKISEDELEVKFVIVVAPEVELGAYTGLKIGKEEPTVSDELLQKEIDNLLDRNATLVLKEGESKEGDTVVMDFVGSIDGVPFEGGSAENYELILGSHSFIPGFEEQLVGHKAGEHVDVNVTFPENYTEELKGKPAVFACDIHEVKEKKLPELNDEFAKEQKIEGVETVEQLKEHLKANKQKEADKNARSNYMTKLLEKIAEGSKIDIPDEVLANQVESRKQEFVERIKQSNITLEQYLSIVGQTEEQFTESFKGNALKELTNYLILKAVADKENLSNISDEELEFEYAKLGDQYGRSAEEIKKLIEPQLNSFKNDLIMNRADNFLYENND